MARDNFSKSVIEKLRKRVAGRCSNPDCRVPTIGPSDDSDGSISIGVAAHITAASPGGPRYCASLTEKARKSMDNGIWLCSNCSITIDRDIDRHPVELLKKWKVDAEDYAKQELGKRLPHKNDAIDTLTAAFTAQSNRFIPAAISSIHQASSNALEALDPRFAVKTAYDNGATQFGIFPKQNVSLAMRVKKEYAQEYADKFMQLVDHGAEFTINGGAFNIEGSRLFEELTSNSSCSTMTLSPRKVQATQKLWLMNKETTAIENFDDINGTISIGQQSFSYSGTACRDMFIFSYKKPINNENSGARVNITINFEKWSGEDVRALKFFKKLYFFFEKLSEGWKLITALEIDGVEYLRSKEVDFDNSSFPKEILGTLDVINMARTIADELKINITFSPTYSFTADEAAALFEAVEIARKHYVFSKNDLNENITCTLIVEKQSPGFELLSKQGGPMDFEMRQTEGGELQIFGQRIKLPNRIIHIRSATPRILSTSPVEDLSDGDPVSIEWIPSDNFECSVEFIRSAS